MSPAGFLGFLEYLPDGAVQALVLLIILLSSGIIALQQILSFFMHTRRKVIAKTAKAISEHESFLPLVAAASELPQIKDYVKNHETRLNNLDIELREMRQENRCFHMLILRNSLKKTYYDIMSREVFSQQLYQDFLEMYQEYETQGGNGSVISGLRDKLYQAWMEHNHEHPA